MLSFLASLMIRFARYCRVCEAERVIRRCHGAMLCGHRLTVKPARNKINLSPSSTRVGMGRGGKTVTDVRATLGPILPQHDDGHGFGMNRGRGLFSLMRRSSASRDSSRMKIGEIPTPKFNDGGYHSFSSPVKSSYIPPPESCDVSCDGVMGSCDQLPGRSLASPRSMVSDSIPPKSCDIPNTSYDKQLGRLRETPNSRNGLEFIQWDTIPPKSCDISCDTSQDTTTGSTHGRYLDTDIPGRKAVPYSRAEAERLMAMISDPDSDDDSLLDFEWDDSLLDDVKCLSVACASSSSLPPLSVRPLPPSVPALPSSPPLLVCSPLLPALVSLDGTSLENSSGLSESDQVSWGAASESSSAASGNEWVSQQKYPLVGVATDLVPATVSKVSG